MLVTNTCTILLDERDVKQAAVNSGLPPILLPPLTVAVIVKVAWQTREEPTA